MKKSFIITALLMTITNSIAQSHSVQELAGAKVVILTDPTWCQPCRELEAYLQSSSQINELTLAVQGQRVRLPLERYKPNDLNSAQIIQYGFTANQALPAFSLIKSDGSILISGASAMGLSGSTLHRTIRMLFANGPTSTCTGSCKAGISDATRELKEVDENNHQINSTSNQAGPK